jgi:uncharacterized protein YeeX (DUF496 family)
MNLFKFIWKYWTSSIFRKNIQSLMIKIEYQDEFEKQFQEEVEKIRQKTLETYKKRIDSLVYIKDYIDGGTPLSKINELINDFKQEYREIEKELI